MGVYIISGEYRPVSQNGIEVVWIWNLHYLNLSSKQIWTQKYFYELPDNHVIRVGERKPCRAFENEKIRSLPQIQKQPYSDAHYLWWNYYIQTTPNENTSFTGCYKRLEKGTRYDNLRRRDAWTYKIPPTRPRSEWWWMARFNDILGRCKRCWVGFGTHALLKRISHHLL